MPEQAQSTARPIRKADKPRQRQRPRCSKWWTCTPIMAMCTRSRASRFRSTPAKSWP